MTTNQGTEGTAFSFEVLPPMRGKSIESVYRTIDRLMPFNPRCINITTHRSETIYHELSNGTFEKLSMRTRPGTVAIAAAIKGRYGVTTIPHVICSGFSAAEIEEELFDLSFLGIHELLVLRGDRARGENRYTPHPSGHEHAIDLCRQVNRFNEGRLIDGTVCDAPTTPFTYGVAGYPEKHEEAMNLDTDMQHLVQKIGEGAQYVVTQMFFDNKKYFAFVDRLRQMGIQVPVIPGLKPLTTLGHKSLLPKTFHIDFPAELVKEFEHCHNNDDVKALGVEWATQQARELRDAGVPCIHFYSMNAAQSVERIMRSL